MTKRGVLQRAFWLALWMNLIVAALWFMRVPDDLAWWEVVGGGACIGLASLVYRRT